MNYTPQQQQAIDHQQGNIQLIACAGSGKTQVLAERIVRLLKTAGTAPSSIVAFTFTEKAAGELKDRIYRLADTQTAIVTAGAAIRSNRIFTGRQPITAETAANLELVTGTPARLWNNLEAGYQKRLAALADKRRLDNRTPVGYL